VYTKKYTRRNNPQNYIRLLQHYDAALFNLIKKFVPYRANTQVGLVIEPDILHRSKVPTKLPTTEDLLYTGSLVLPDIYTPGGFVQDGDGEPFRDNPGYVQEGVINGSEATYLRVLGEGESIIDEVNYREGIQILPATLEEIAYDMVVIDGTQIVSPLTLNGNANEYNNGGVADQPSTSGSLTGPIDLGISSYGRDVRVRGSQYTFYTYATSGSGATRSEPYLISSSRYDYSDPFGATVLDNAYSQFSNVGNYAYCIDVYGGKAFKDTSAFGNGGVNTLYTASSAIFENSWSSDYGLRILTSYSSSTLLTSSYNTSNYWGLSSLGLSYSVPANGRYTGSVQLPAFYFDIDDLSTQNRLYTITLTVYQLNPAVTVSDSLVVKFGSSTSTNTQAIDITTTATTYTYTVKPNGPWLYFEARQDRTGGLSTATVVVSDVKVQPLNYRAQTQDFHLVDSYGMRNARYDGCKLTAADFNVDSPDTVDGGPVVEITLVNGNSGTVVPSNLGNLSVQ
jgi:hypothetical protein